MYPRKLSYKKSKHTENIFLELWKCLRSSADTSQRGKLINNKNIPVTLYKARYL